MGKFKIFVFAATLAAVMLAGCRKESAGGRMPIVVSIEPQRWLVEQIGGERVDVSTLLGKNADPENFDPTLGSMKLVEQSELFIITGTNSFEGELVKKMGFDSERLVDLSVGIEPIYGTHCKHNHPHDADEESEKLPDPHIWTSVRNLRVMSESVRDALVNADAEGAELYKANYSSLVARLDSIDRVLTAKSASKHNRAFLMWHPSLSYFARDYGFEQLWLGAEGKELSVKAVNDAMKEAEEHGAKLLVVQSSDDRNRSKLLAREGDMRMVEINSMAYDIPAELLKLVDNMQ